MSEELNELRSRNQTTASHELSEFRQDLRSAMTTLRRIELDLASANIVDMRREVSETRTILNELRTKMDGYNIPELRKTVEGHEKAITRGLAAVGTLQVIIGIIAIFRRELFGG